MRTGTKIQVYLPAKQDPTYRVKVKITQQNNQGRKIVDNKMRKKKTMMTESPSMESWNRNGKRLQVEAIALADWRVGCPTG